jgi:hypothetical protein
MLRAERKSFRETSPENDRGIAILHLSAAFLHLAIRRKIIR